eukprot:TRINITY_DN42709_c0_g1_i1.p1 TRINITY_DN42709_c0_g1~~TRINITY_DN42709_c0_g1_i1.p1  ORF type:complete len:295 (-),score=58.23 TRINITY_DN42709_c0_g1_i1:89-907(-)
MSFFSRLLGFGAKGSLSSFGKAYELVARDQVAKATHRFRFALETPETVLGLPVGHHLEVRLPGGSGLGRPYTPVTGDAQLGHFDLVVKVYPNGQVGNYLDSLKVGDKAEIAGPFGEITYKGPGTFEIENPFANPKKRTVQCSSVGMIAGGTGIAPMYQIARHAASQAEDPLEMSLLYASRSPEDVMLQDELSSLSSECSRFKVDFSVDKVEDGKTWSGPVGRVSSEMLTEAFGKLPQKPEMLFICGPGGFHEAVKEILTEELNYPHDAIFEF